MLPITVHTTFQVANCLQMKLLYVVRSVKLLHRSAVSSLKELHRSNNMQQLYETKWPFETWSGTGGGPKMRQ